MWLLSSRIAIRESGLLEGFRDCHCHLLPGVDDGVQEMDETMQILEEWEHLGVKEVWLTPHIMEDMPNRPDELRARMEEVKNCYAGSIELHLSAEQMMDGLFVKLLEEGNVMPIGTDGQRLLVETSYFTPPINMAALLERVKAKGYEPILAHPERYQYMNRNDYRLWKERGVKLQLNVPSLVGAYGINVQKKAEWLLYHDMYDYCGSDTHSLDYVEYFLDSTISRKTVRKVKELSEGQVL